MELGITSHYTKQHCRNVLREIKCSSWKTIQWNVFGWPDHILLFADISYLNGDVKNGLKRWAVAIQTFPLNWPYITSVNTKTLPEQTPLEWNLKTETGTCLGDRILLDFKRLPFYISTNYINPFITNTELKY